MTFREAQAKGVIILKNAGIETPAADAGVLLSHASGRDRTFLYVHGDREIEPESLLRYMSYLERRTEGMPVQYITGHCEFMSLDFIVNPGVLIPRPETEILVEAALELLPADGRRIEVLDMGTGSGCIAVSIAHMLENSRVTAVDISADALATARINARRNGVSDRLEFLSGDLFEGLDGRSFDAIISNPPYIRKDDISELQREVAAFEPHTALDGGPDGYDFYRRIAGQASGYLKTGGLLLLETGMGQAGEVAKLLEGRYADIEIRKDLAGIDRVVTARLV